jgi:ubiquinone/menaquinone biosynthesis C-methylase UbiE
MNRHHSKLTDWGLSHVSIKMNDKILDVGCGGGRTIDKLAALASAGKIYGIDYSESSVAAARRTNARWIDPPSPRLRRAGSGRVEIQQGSVSQLQFANETFDLVTAIETHLFWPDLPNDFREIFRVLKPGGGPSRTGTFLIVAEIYRGGKHLEGVRKKIFDKHLAANMNLLTPDEHRALFTGAGFSDAQIFEEIEKGWICAVGRKSS